MWQIRDLTNPTNSFYIIISLFVIVLLAMGGLYYWGSPIVKKNMGNALGVFGQAILIFNILLLIYDKLLQRFREQKETVAKLNDFTNSAIGNIFGKFASDKEHLGELYNEIFKGEYKTPDQPKLTYEEETFMFILFQTIENVYRTYYLSGADREKYDVSQYDGWEKLILQVVASPKSQLFYKENRQLFNSLGFDDYLDAAYFTKVKLWVPIK